MGAGTAVIEISLESPRTFLTAHRAHLRCSVQFCPLVPAFALEWDGFSCPAMVVPPVGGPATFPYHILDIAWRQATTLGQPGDGGWSAVHHHGQFHDWSACQPLLVKLVQ